MAISDTKLLVCDLDNTLYDWVGYFVPCFYSMVDKAVEITGCDRERLLDDFRGVHQKYHDSEHPFSLFETDTMARIFSGKDISVMRQELDAALYVFNSCRKKMLRTHPGVIRTLEELAAHGVLLVAHTESRLYGTIDRLKRLGLEKFFSRIYCRERPNSEHPNPETGARWLSEFPMEKITELTHHQTKPNTDVLLEICANEGYCPHDAAYVGDSIARDIFMAKRAEVKAIWAKYGSRHDPDLYAKLVRISHWTPADVAREKKLNEEAQETKPDYILNESFSEILEIFEHQFKYATH